MKYLTKSEVITIIIGLVLSVLLLFMSGAFKGNTYVIDNKIINNVNNLPTAEGNNISKDSKIQIIDTVVGTGADAKSGDTVSVHYTGMLVDGKVFDSSVARGTPFDFQLGAGKVILGWEKGILGMKVGGKRRLIISPEYAYGAQGVPGVIPANSTLYFDVELVGVK